MDPHDAIDLGRQAMMMTLLISAPVLIAGMIVGLLIGLMQALTQIQEQTIAFVPKIVAMVAVLAITLPWIVQRVVEYSQTLIVEIPQRL
jgi:flagellar biosynthetic protein FliQ